MDSVRPLNVRAQRHLLGWRARRGRTTAIRHLDVLAVAIASKRYRCVKLYQADEFPTRPPLLWVFALGPDRHVRIAVGVRATPGGSWGYYEVGQGGGGHLSPCDDAAYAAEQVDAVLRHRMFPNTW